MHGSDPVQQMAFDFADPATWPAAFADVETMFLLRPPAVANVRRDLIPAVAAARSAGVRHVVFLSLQGAEHNRLTPHAAVEKWLRASGMAWTFIRPSFFCQNLSSTHASDIRDRDAIMVPAGGGATAFVDAEDVGAVAAAALGDPAEHAGRAWTVTGPRALTYEQVAQILTGELGRPIRYARPGLAAYARHARTALGMPWPMVAVTAAIYTSARFGLAAGLTGDVRAVLGRDPIDLSAFAHRERAAWARPAA
nr:SDR family oxidoreductase [Planobispora longispora]